MMKIALSDIMSDKVVFTWQKKLQEHNKIGGFLTHGKYGYIRVSTKDQNPERQSVAFEKYGIRSENVYLDKASGKNFERPAYQKMLKMVKKGDVITIKSIDRLGRNYGEILDQWRFITKDLSAGIEVLDIIILFIW